MSAGAGPGDGFAWSGSMSDDGSNGAPSGDLLDRVASLGTLWAAARRAARGKRDRTSVARCLFNLETVVVRLHTTLLDGRWQPGRPGRHVVHDPKTREIVAAPFEDRIVHQALCEHIGPLLERHLIPRTYACRFGLGTHAAIRQAVVWSRAYRFALHLDVRKFFPSIDHAILLAQLEHDIRNPRVVGYMDDMLLFSDDRAQLSGWGDAIEQACWRQRLRLHPWQVMPTRQGITWLGFRILPDQVRVKRTSVVRAKKRLAHLLAEACADPARWERFMASLRSTFAHWAHGDTWRLRDQTLRELGLLSDDDLPDG